jgi:hypothetical protein
MLLPVSRTLGEGRLHRRGRRPTHLDDASKVKVEYYSLMMRGGEGVDVSRLLAMSDGADTHRENGLDLAASAICGVS